MANRENLAATAGIRRISNGQHEYLALDHRDWRWSCCCSAAGKISELMGDVAQGIKAFKKGMSDDDDCQGRSAGRGEGRSQDHRPPAGPDCRRADGEPQGGLNRPPLTLATDMADRLRTVGQDAADAMRDPIVSLPVRAEMSSAPRTPRAARALELACSISAGASLSSSASSR